MKGEVIVILILALLHSVTSCTTQNRTYTCYKQEMTTYVTYNWCLEIRNLFRCKEEHTITKAVSSTCRRTVCCDGYQRSNSRDVCKAVCFGSNYCQNGGSCDAPNKCICPSGYVSPKCDDENECSIKNGGCSHRCVNTKGSYYCSCPPGFTLDSNQRTCKAVCFGSNVCQNGGSCVAPNKCICRSGYVSPNCDDENECSVKNGGCSHTCVNTKGSYHRSCPPGFTLDSKQLTCKDDNECSIKTGECSHRCVNTEGSYHCSCPPGFTLDSNQLTCKDVKECSVNNGGCAHSCVNTEGSHYCSCNSGFSLGSDQLTCKDDNECSVKNGGCSHTCNNTEGAYRCSCPPGFTLDSHKLTCKDDNECSVKNGGCSHTCTNTDGSYHCSCPPGFTMDSDQLTCKAEATTATTTQVTTPAECGNDNGGCSHSCIGMNETVQCTCPLLKKLADDNVTCIDVKGFYYGLCTLLAVCFMVTTVLLARKWYVRRGNQRSTDDEQKLIVVVTSSQEYCDEFKNKNLQKPPPYKKQWIKKI